MTECHREPATDTSSSNHRTDATLPRTLHLADVTTVVLPGLLRLALAQADADDVTPPRGATADMAGGWNQDRIDWFLAYHHAASGLDGPTGEKTWAVLVDGELAGSVRLKSVGVDAAETGIWLGRTFRGQGIGSGAMELVLTAARAVGVTRIVASTATSNVAAQRLLASGGADLTHTGNAVTARMDL
ncbi:GNAT family N-acetyltransferase [Pseudarthrobacter sp. PS3-L1]|uniref:GNAT family N-acetyltransferase n=1 Tax=Pseudarthrobacter sp. PS3-L1 TaxID=3046207 RepID=UPI0024B9BD43|nr:GNAT family N-acetyltransferase [Pseudarthrobacter sp. PS3-L1]MDJ0320242.1 GNAT family N-acetyltransferase [Pseudarthrobacter sp. PS3-L1]